MMAVMMTVMSGQCLLKHLRRGDLPRLRRVLKFRCQLRQRLGLRGVAIVLCRGCIGLELRGHASRDVRVLCRTLLLDLVQLAEETGGGRDAGRTLPQYDRRSGCQDMIRCCGGGVRGIVRFENKTNGQACVWVDVHARHECNSLTAAILFNRRGCARQFVAFAKMMPI